MKLLKDWNEGNPRQNVENMSRAIMQTFERWSKTNLEVEFPKNGDVEEKFGLPYTSTSDFAALWNCQGKARYKRMPEWEFLALAYSENMLMVAVFENETENHLYVIIG